MKYTQIELEEIRYFEEKLTRAKHPDDKIKCQKQLDLLKQCYDIRVDGR